MAEASIAETPTMESQGQARRRYVLTLLMIAYVLSFLDRQVLSRSWSSRSRPSSI
jgi:hypothetical protein